MNTKTKKIQAFLIAVVMVLSVFMQVGATEAAGKIVISVEAFTLGGGYLIEPEFVCFEEGDSLAELFVKLLDNNGYTCTYTGEIEDGFYMTALYGDNIKNVVENPNPPQEILNECGSIDAYIEHTDKNGNCGLGGFDFTYMSGWMPFLNNEMADLGMSQIYPEDGDSIRVQFSLYGYGADLGKGWFEAYYETADRDELHRLIAEKGYENVPEEYKSVIENICASQEEIDSAAEAVSALTDTKDVSSLKKVTDDIVSYVRGDAGLLLTADFLKNSGSTASDWLAMAFARSGISDENYGDYLNAARIYIEQKYEEKGKLDTARATEWSRMALAILACGGDPTSFGINRYNGGQENIDLIAGGSYADVNPARQGLNGPVWALIMLGTLGFEIPDEKFYKLTEYVISKQKADGGFALSGTVSEPDTTAMTLIALASQRSSENTYPAYGGEMKTPAEVINEALDALGNMQNEDGDFGSWETCNSESASYVLSALCALGIDCREDERFIKNGKTLIDGILKYRHESGGFMHTCDEDADNPEATGTVNRMATEQVLCALQSYINILEGKRHFFDFRPEKNNISNDEAIKINQPWVGAGTAMFEIESQEERTVAVKVTAYLDGTEQTYVAQAVEIAEGKKDYSVDLRGLSDSIYDRIEFEITAENMKIAEYSHDYIASGMNIGTGDITVLWPEMGNKSATVMIKAPETEKIMVAFATYCGDKLSGIELNEITLNAGTGRYQTAMPENTIFDTAKIIIYDSTYAPVASSTVRYN